MTLTLKKSSVLPGKLYYRLRSSDGKCPLLYGLLKVHKPDVLLRPIVSFVNFPTYHLSKHLVSLLAPLVGNGPTHVKNSIHLKQTLGANHVRVSFHMVSFTNMLACQIANNHLCADSTLNACTSLSVDLVVTLLRFCLSTTNLAYCGKFTFAVTPISIVVANLMMEDVEESSIISPPFWKRYIDDVCTCLGVGSLCEHLNSIEPSINFTFELEQDYRLPFLHVEFFHNSDSSLSTNVYSKNTHTDKYLRFDSHHSFGPQITSD